MTLQELREEITCAEARVVEYQAVGEASGEMSARDVQRKLKGELLQRLREEVLATVGDPECRRELVREMLQLRRELA